MIDFFRLLTHDLLNQIGAVDLNLQVLPTVLRADDPSYVKMAPFIARSQQAAADMMSLLEDVQHYARTRDNEPPSPTRCDLSAKARDIALTLKSTADARNVVLKTQIPEGIHAFCGSEGARRAIKVLAGEAIRAGFPGTVVEVSVTAHPVPTVEISVSVEGVFDESRETVATFLAKKMVDQGTLLLQSAASRSSAQILFPPA